MRMRKLNWDTLGDIKEGMVIKFRLSDGSIKTGVVYFHGSVGFGGPVIYCNGQNRQKFTIFSPVRTKSVDSFAILKKHSPVAKFGQYGEWDFVSNH